MSLMSGIAMPTFDISNFKFKNFDSYLKKQRHELEQLKLKQESIKVKKFWETRKQDFTSLKKLFDTEEQTSCSYFTKCKKLLSKILDIFGISIAAFDFSGNRCFCKKCLEKRKDDDK